MFFSVSPIKPGFRRRRRAAPLRLFLFLRNVFLFFFFRARPFFFFFQARARFLVALLLSEYLFLTSKQQRHRCRTPRLKSAASGCVSPISPCSDARDGRRRSFFKFSGKMFFPKTRFFPFQYEYSIDFGGKGFSNGPLWPACGPFVAPLWPLVARCGPLVAPCGPFVFYGRTFEKFSRGPLCGPPGHRATRNFSKVRSFRFFSFFGRRSTV